MPIYVYLCADCGEVSERKSTIAARRQSIRCPRCKGRATRDLTKEIMPTKARTTAKWPIESAAAGVGIDQVEEAQRRDPDFKFNPYTGDMVFRSLHHQEACLHKIGMVNRD